jgi:hypothetical protein
VLANGYMSQSTETDATTGGQAVYNLSLTNAGNFVIQALVNAPNTGANSFYVNIDAQPVDPTGIWDIPVTSGFEQRLIGWRGNGTPDLSQYAPKVFALSAGTHQIVIRGREPGVQLQSLSVLPAPPAPTNLRIIAGN